MKLWVGIIFLVVASQLGINARPIPRPFYEGTCMYYDQAMSKDKTVTLDFPYFDEPGGLFLKGPKDLSYKPAQLVSSA